MKERVLLVDFENVQKLDLSRLQGDFQVTIFVGDSQKNIPFGLVQDTQRFGEHLEWLKIEGNGSNALDFHIAYYLGKLCEQQPGGQYFILSKDKGFDPLVRHLSKIGLSCTRINSLMELEARQLSSEDPNYKRVVELLGKVEKKARPRKRTTLSQHISSMFQKKLSEAEIEQLMDMLFVSGMIAESNKVLSYNF